MALLPSLSQIPAQRVSLSETASTPVYASREWYRFFDNLHTYTPTPVTYVPAITTGSNVTAVTPGTCFYNQMGSVISLTGTLTVTVSGAGEARFTMTPPVRDDLTVSAAAGLFAAATAGATAVGTVTVSADTLAFRITASGAGTADYVFNVNYQIV